MKQRWGVIGLVAVISFVSGGWLLQQSAAGGGKVYQQARLFDDVLSHVSNFYVDSIPETDLYNKPLRACSSSSRTRTRSCWSATISRR